jgi:hypothetical protein
MHKVRKVVGIILLAVVASFGAPQAFAGPQETPGIVSPGPQETPGVEGPQETPGALGPQETPGILDAIWGVIITVWP